MRKFYEDHRRAHCYRRIASMEYMLFCDWLTETGHSGLCAAFWVHLDSQRVTVLYPHSPSDYSQPDERLDSSVFLSVGHLSHLQNPADQSDYAPI